MRTVMWNKKKIITVAIAAIITLYLCRGKGYPYYKQATLNNVNAEQLWEFLADFSNSEKHLNPHLKIMKIEEESGNYDNWKYVVHYSEPLPTWPYLNTYAEGHFNIRKDHNKHLIKSQHNTCIFYSLYCTNSNVLFVLTQVNDNTLYEEHIDYFCPPLFSSFCHNTNTLLRNIYFDNMIQHFKIKYY